MLDTNTNNNNTDKTISAKISERTERAFDEFNKSWGSARERFANLCESLKEDGFSIPEARKIIEERTGLGERRLRELFPPEFKDMSKKREPVQHLRHKNAATQPATESEKETGTAADKDMDMNDKPPSPMTSETPIPPQPMTVESFLPEQRHEEP